MIGKFRTYKNNLGLLFVFLNHKNTLDYSALYVDLCLVYTFMFS